MEKPFRLLVLASLVAIPLTLQARVCVVHDLDTTACQKGDDLLFMPHTYGSEQLPIEFAGKKCDFNKQIALNKGGVVCTYAGAKEIVDAKEDPQKKNYAAKYSEVQQNAEGWYQYDDQYWRLLPEQGEVKKAESNLDAIQEGDLVQLYIAECQHDENGVETRGEFKLGSLLPVDASFFLKVGKLRNGSVLETVTPTSHSFVQVKKSKW